MAYSRVPFTYTGGPQVFPTNFALGVLEADHIRVTVDGVVDGLGDPVEYAFTYNAATGDVTVLDALVEDQTGVIQRSVPLDELVADFEAGDDVSKRNLVRATKQTLMAVQEAADGREADNILITEAVETINDIAAGIADNVAQTTADRIAAEAAAVTATAGASTATTQAGIAVTNGNAAVAANAAAQIAKTDAEAAATSADADAAQTALDRIAVAADRATAVSAKDTAVAAQATASAAAVSADADAAVAAAQAAIALDAAADVQGNIIPVGAILEFASGVPSGWLACDGSAVTPLYPELRAYLVAAGQPFGNNGTDPLLPALIKAVRKANFGTPDLHITHELGAVLGAPSYVASVANTWNTRPLNTVKHNDIAGASLASNLITLPAGTYYIDVQSIGGNVNDHQLRLWNTTTGAEVLRGQKYYAQTNSNQYISAGMRGKITLAATSVLRVDHYTQSANTWGLGISNINSGNVVYASVEVSRLDSLTGVPCIKAFGEVDVVGMADLAALLTSIATQAEAEAGSNNLKLMTPLRTRQAINAYVPFTKQYVSTPQTMVAGGLLTLPHGLGAAPKLFRFCLECITAQNGYSVGDVLEINPGMNHVASLSAGISVTSDATNILVRCGSYGAIVALNKSAGTASDQAYANWRLVVRAWE